MDTQVRTPQQVFMLPQRLVVPLFQRPYVWNEDNQWAPLWRDITRVAERKLLGQVGGQQPHFLGAVVLQQLQNPVGSLQTRTVIDGQQRLSTLQIMLDAVHSEFVAIGADQPALRVEGLIVNSEAFCTNAEDRFKVWPTNRDRAAFNAVMGAEPPVNYASLDEPGAKFVQAHRFFAEAARSWLELNGDDEVQSRAEALDHTVRELLQLVVIELTAEENAQEIFETLNARGAQLTAADLIKNFVFQRLMEEGVEVETVYEEHWKEFETGFWEKEVSVGRVNHSRSSVYLNHLLISRTGEEIVAREVFTRFKSFADFDYNAPMMSLLGEVSSSSAVYRQFVEGATANNPIDRLQLFAYRSSTLESEVFKPVMIWLLDPAQDPVPDQQLTKAVEALESWLVRRMLVRAGTKSYTQIAAELITHLAKEDRSTAGDVVTTFLSESDVASRYWPDDDEVRTQLSELLAYKRLRQGRLRMVLEALEDHERGWRGENEGMGGERVPRGKFHIEHIMPRSWEAHWPLGSTGADARNQLVHTLGNLTLLTAPLNSSVSNSSWSDKRAALAQHDVLKTNVALLADAGEVWDEDAIRARTTAMTETILEIWPVPSGHTSSFGKLQSEDSSARTGSTRVKLVDLVSAGLLAPGTVLFTSSGDRYVTVLADGRLDVDGVAYDSPSGAARAIAGYSVNGWPFFRLEPGGTRSLNDLYEQYVDSTSADADTNEEGMEDESEQLPRD